MAERPAPSTRPVLQKLLLRPGSRVLLLNAPPGYADQFPPDSHLDTRSGEGEYDFIQLFATRRDELRTLGPKLRQALKAGGLLWVAYPKSKALPTDLNRDIVRTTLAEVGGF